MPLIDLIEEAIVSVPLQASGKAAVIGELIETLRRAGKLTDVQAATRAVLDREAKGSTGLSDGIAVPHGKTTAVSTLTLAIGISNQGIDFEAIDGNPVRLVFLIMAPPDQSGPHIEALAEIARMSRSKAFCSALMDCRSPEEVVRLFKED